MKILAIDTSTDACSAALCLEIENQETKHLNFIERFEVAPQAHTRIILPMIDSLLNEAGISLKELDALAFGCGPGSFTGLRIAASIVQGLSFGIAKPVIAVSTLRAIAQGAFRDSEVSQCFAWLDARLDQIYWGLFKLDDKNIMQAVSKEQVQSEALVEFPKEESPEFPTRFKPEDWPRITAYPRAIDIAIIARSEYLLGHVKNAIDAQPVYLRNDVVR